MVRLIVALSVAIGLGGCAKITLAWADLRPDGVVATPAILGEFAGAGPVSSPEEWKAIHAPAIRAALEENIYGAFPDSHKLEVMQNKTIDHAAFGGSGVLSEYKLKAVLRFGDHENETDEFYMNVVLPAGKPDAPIILMQTFCPRWDTMPHEGISGPEDAGGCGGAGSGIMKYIFGRYIATPPLEMILQRGYGVAAMFPSEFAPDRNDTGLAALEALSKGRGDRPRWGAIAAWGLGFSFMIDALENNGVTGPAIAYGHSRYGKSALVAAAWDERVAGVIAHQSGTGGASLNREKVGESVAAITDNYPHWFADAYARAGAADYDLAVDQHHLLALAAPRPILLGNARRDVWSDPNGAFRAAMGADPVYELLGAIGLDQDRLDQWKPGADIAFWIRPGTHGVVKEDWPAFLEFMDAHFGEQPAS